MHCYHHAATRNTVPLLSLLVGMTMTVPTVWASDLIAHYLFETNGDDGLARSPQFVLTTAQWSAGVPPFFVVTNAPFTNGVLHVNGLFEPNGHFVHYLGTAPMPELHYDSFTFSLDFYPLPQKRGRHSLSKLENTINDWTRDRYLHWRGIDSSSGLVNQDNILTGGYMYRWIGFNRGSGWLHLTLNNQSFVHDYNGAVVKPERWHNLICSVDLRRRQILTMFDGKPLETIQLPTDFKLDVLGSPEEANDREFTFANHSSGSVYYGYVGELRIFGRALDGSELLGLYSAPRRDYCILAKRSFPWAEAFAAGVVTLLAVWFLRSLRRRQRQYHSVEKPA